MSFHLLPLLTMTTAQRFLSLSFLGATALLIAPLASAQGPFADLTDDQRSAIRSDLEECKDLHGDDHEARRTCADGVFASHGVERPERHGRRGNRGPRQDIPEDVREQLKACREDNEGDREAAKACAMPIFEANDIEPPHHGRGKKIGKKFRSQITETCGERENTDEWRECAKDARGTLKTQFQEEHPKAFNRFTNRRSRHADFREQLRSCLDLGDHDSLRACVVEVRDAIREQAQN